MKIVMKSNMYIIIRTGKDSLNLFLKTQLEMEVVNYPITSKRLYRLQRITARLTCIDSIPYAGQCSAIVQVSRRRHIKPRGGSLVRASADHTILFVCHIKIFVRVKYH